MFFPKFNLSYNYYMGYTPPFDNTIYASTVLLSYFILLGQTYSMYSLRITPWELKEIKEN